MRGTTSLSRRALLRTGVLAGGAAVLAACAGATPAPSGGAAPAAATTAPQEEPAAASVTGSVSMWHFPATDDDMEFIFKPLITGFNEQYPDITVNVEILPWGGRREKMLTAYAGGEAPDIAYVNIDTMSLFGTNGVLLPLDDVVSQEAWDDLAERLVPGLVWEGERLMYPCQIYFYNRLYNKRLFEEIGQDVDSPPETWEDMFALGEKAKAKNYFLTDLNTMAWDTEMITTLWQAGGRLFNDDFTKVQLDTEAAYDTWKYEADMFLNGYVPKEGAVGSDAEAASVAATNYWIDEKMVLSRASNSRQATDTMAQNPDLDFGLCPTLKYKRQVVLGTGACWGVFKNRPALEPVMKWLNYLIEPEPHAFYCSITKNVPARNAAMEYWEAEPIVREFGELHFPYMELHPDATHFWQEGKVICGPYRQAAALGLSTVEEALAGAQAEFQALVDEWNANKASS